MKTLALFVAALAVSAGVALAQTPPAQPSVMTKVENWTSEQWNAAKVEWTKEKIKWTECQQQSTDQKLTGRKAGCSSTPA